MQKSKNPFGTTAQIDSHARLMLRMKATPCDQEALQLCVKRCSKHALLRLAQRLGRAFCKGCLSEHMTHDSLASFKDWLQQVRACTPAPARPAACCVQQPLPRPAFLWLPLWASRRTQESPLGVCLLLTMPVRAVRAARPAAPALRDLMHHGIVVLFVFLQVHMPKGACMTAHSGRLVHPGVAPSHWHVTART